MRRLLWICLVAGCNQSARAQAEPEPAEAPEVAGESSGGADAGGDALGDEEFEGAAPTDVDAEVQAAAAAKVDAAIAAAKDRGEQDRLAIAQQRNELAATSAELDARLASIASLEGRIDELLGAGKVEREHRRERVDLLANLIATMSPQAAATMLAQMSDAQAQDLLFSVAQADKRKAAKLIATMPPERAAAIGQRYLTRDPASPESLVPTTPPPAGGVATAADGPAAAPGEPKAEPGAKEPKAAGEPAAADEPKAADGSKAAGEEVPP
jgi:flagellar motility protein MotE (MotC chaperone)